jgi:hypothetical protein
MTVASDGRRDGSAQSLSGSMRPVGPGPHNLKPPGGAVSDMRRRPRGGPQGLAKLSSGCWLSGASSRVTRMPPPA